MPLMRPARTCRKKEAGGIDVKAAPTASNAASARANTKVEYTRKDASTAAMLPRSPHAVTAALVAQRLSPKLATGTRAATTPHGPCGVHDPAAATGEEQEEDEIAPVLNVGETRPRWQQAAYATK